MWMFISKRFCISTNVFKTIAVSFSLVVLMSCVTTTEFNAANEINRMDNTLATLMVTAIQNGNRNEKQEIAIEAALAHAKGDEMAKSGNEKIAIAYYRIAAIGYWRDDIDANDEQLIAVVDAAKKLCNAMQSKNSAPDRDCFVTQISLLINILEQKFEQIATVPQENFDANNIIDIRRLIDEVGYAASSRSAKPNGFLPNLIAYVKQNAEFLNNHPTMESYIRKNLMDIVARYKVSVTEIQNYYQKNGNENRKNSLLASHAVFNEFLSSTGNTNDEKIGNMIDVWLKSE